MEWAQADSSIVITFDEDFADARMFPVGSHQGVIRLRVWPTTIEKTEEALDRLLAEVSEQDLPGSLVIVDDRRIHCCLAATRGVCNESLGALLLEASTRIRHLV